MTHAARPPTRKPWPLWPIAVAILVSIAGYTYLRLAYAKPGKPHEPFAETRQRVESDRLRAAGWTRLEAPFEAEIEVPAADAAVQALLIRPEAVEELHQLSAENWHLPIEYSAVSAPATLAAGAALAVHLQAELDQARAHIVGFDIFRKGADVVALPRWEPYPEELTPRRPRATGTIVFPAAALPPGQYRVTLPALKQSAQWELTVAAPPSS
ncbi:MAG TPA: hypothetical protein VK163_04875 [Opitutaceae bacterium]|nr:hypothetical protein [Opitutaceae bacterium]